MNDVMFKRESINNLIQMVADLIIALKSYNLTKEEVDKTVENFVTTKGWCMNEFAKESEKAWQELYARDEKIRADNKTLN